MTERVTHSVGETEAVAGEFARTLKPGAVVALHGDLGAGKTQFVRGVVKALGGNGRAVSSPTFTLLNIYPVAGGMSVFHLDAYRTSGADDLEGIGFEELLEQGGIVMVEWPSRVEELLPADTVQVTIEAIDEGTRRITLPGW